MCRMQYVLGLVALYVGLVHSFSWDFATSSRLQLQFYFEGKHTDSINILSGDMYLITYDPVGNRMFFVDLDSTETAIFSMDLATKKIISAVMKRNKSQKIKGLTFDPAKEILFWIEQYSTEIRWFSLKPNFKNKFGNVLIKISEKQLTICAIAVDSCGGYIYWTTSDLIQKQLPSKIERARFDGSEREVVIGSDLQMPFRLVLDQQTQKLYWIGGTQHYTDNMPTAEKHFFIESADLNGKHRTILYRETGNDEPVILAVSKDSIYWVHLFQRTVNQLPKNPSVNAKPTQTSIAAWDEIATNYKIEDQIRGVENCEPLKRLVPNSSVTDENVSLNISPDERLFCVHGMKVRGMSQCECAHGYTGERCDVAICQNYCFQGYCMVGTEEQPVECRCHAGYSGQRCEVNVCRGYCLNNGTCSLNEKNEPVCTCKEYYEGERCDVSTCLNKCLQKLVSVVWGTINADVKQAVLDKGLKSTWAPTAV